MSQNVDREKHVYGESWAKHAGGYFGDLAIAKDYVTAIMRAVAKESPSAIVDIGGGTGFICEQIIDAGIRDDVRLITVDEADEQLIVCANPRITPINGMLQTFRRANVARDDERLMIICRSVLHYAGKLAFESWLIHVRGELKTGEWFVHQSGCSLDAWHTDALNRLFELMGVDKWLPSRDEFVGLLNKTGFEVTEDFAMPSVPMISTEIVERYGVTKDLLSSIKNELSALCAGKPDAFEADCDKFVFHFPYRVFSCRAR